MIDVNSFTTDVKDQILGILSAIGTNLVCPVIAAAAVIYCVFQIPQLFKAHRDGMSDVFCREYNIPSYKTRTQAGQELIKLINNAQESVDFAFYGFSHQEDILKAVMYI